MQHSSSQSSSRYRSVLDPHRPSCEGDKKCVIEVVPSRACPLSCLSLSYFSSYPSKYGRNSRRPYRLVCCMPCWPPWAKFDWASQVGRHQVRIISFIHECWHISPSTCAQLDVPQAFRLSQQRVNIQGIWCRTLPTSPRVFLHRPTVLDRSTERFPSEGDFLRL